MKYYYPEKPTLISVTQSLFARVSNDPSWVAEDKWNGRRLQLHNEEGFEFWGRHNSKLSYRPNEEILDSLQSLDLPKGYNLFDGELRHNKVVGVRNKIILYDIFIWNGELLLDTPFEDRRKMLEDIIEIGSEPLGIPEHYKSDFQFHFDQNIPQNELEGLVIKKKSGMLNLGRVSGQKSSWMLKVRKPSKKYRF